MNDHAETAVAPREENAPHPVKPPAMHKSNVPDYKALQEQLAEASLLVDDIVLKNYLTNLTELKIVPFDENLRDISAIRFFKISEMVYQKDEYSTYKFASVFNSVQNLNCSVFIIADSDGSKTDFYMGVRSLDDKRTTSSLKGTLLNALRGQFPGVKIEDMRDPEAEEFLKGVQSKNIAAVSCVAQNKDEKFTDNDSFLQGLEKLALAMQGQRYTAVILAKSAPAEQLDAARAAYESIYTQLSPFASLQVSYGTSTALSVSNAFSSGTSKGTSHTVSDSAQKGTSVSKTTTVTESETTLGLGSSILKGIVAVGSILAAPMTGGASIIGGGMVMGLIPSSSETTGSSESESVTESSSETHGESDTATEGTTESTTDTKTVTADKSDNLQLTVQNKTLLNTLERIDAQLKRIDECESIGMWECAAYFLSDVQETAEMTAGTYKALMKGTQSGVETSAINVWDRHNPEQTSALRDYITNFIHPVFEYRSLSASVPLTASSLVSGNELAIHMGLPRKSVCGFPVIEHADFGKDVVKYGRRETNPDFILGKVFSMGSATETDVRLDRDSLTMHTFITGSTGSGKSNTVYEILNQLRGVYKIPFLVVEPAKGEYKNVFGQFPDVAVYGTNPKKTPLLRINPFKFPPDIHVLEHLDRLVELFNVCWPMYAAMPAILKEALEKAYVSAGWDISASENPKGEVYPNFTDLLEQIETVINESRYSADSKGDYSGALCTRVRSLTNGLNGLIFAKNDLADAELFDKNVIIDLSRVGSAETKSLIMGLLVMKLNEYRMTSGKMNSPLTHITVLEEAHNILKRTSAEQSSETANILGKSVELIANSIAEMRTYGEGFIIADQSPGLLDMSAIRNTNTKIILRLPELSDRQLVGFSASLDDEQADELSKLERGVAAIYQNNWAEPILVKVNKCPIAEKQFDSSGRHAASDDSNIRDQVIRMLIQGRVLERLDFDVNKIEQGLDSLNVSTGNREFIEEQVAEYKDEGLLSIWRDDNFKKLSKRVVDILGVRANIEACVTSAADNIELSGKLAALVKQSVTTASDAVALAVSQCFMKDLSAGRDEQEARERLYRQWIEFVRERGAKL